MTDIPLWAAIIFAFLVVSGAGLTLMGCIGLARFDTFYARVHAPTLGTSYGLVSMAIASALYFTLTGGRPVFHEIVIVVFVTVTTPVTLMTLARAALHRDRSDGKPGIPLPAPRSSANTAPETQ